MNHPAGIARIALSLAYAGLFAGCQVVPDGLSGLLPAPLISGGWPSKFSYALCQGTFDDPLQGLAAGKDHSIVWSFGSSLARTDTYGNMLKRRAVEAPHGDIEVVNSRIFAMLPGGRPGEGGGITNTPCSVWVYQESDLELVRKHPLAEVSNARAIGAADDKIVVFASQDGALSALEYNPKLTFLGRQPVTGAPAGIEIVSACFAEGSWWLATTDGQLLNADPGFRVISTFAFDASAGITGLPGNRFLIGRNFERWRARAVLAKSESGKGPILVGLPPPPPGG